MIRYILMRFPEGKKKALTLSYDDCCPEDRRLVGILNAHGIRATFNLNSDFLGKGNMMTADEIVPLFAGHEIATHGASHRAPGRVTAQDHIDDILRDRRALEALTGSILRGHAYPDTGIRDLRGGVAYAEIRRRLDDAGLSYARTLGGDNADFAIPEDLYAWMPTAHHDNPELFAWLDRFLADKVDDAYPVRREPRLFYLWGHAYEFERKGSWDRIESFCEKAGGHSEIWYATNIEIADYIAAYRRLVYSLDKTRVYNPSAQALWLEAAISGKTYCVRPGETVVLDEE